jgi:hypothetical protein
MTLADELVAYQSLRQRHLDRIEPQLAQLQSQIAQQLQDLQTQEQPLIEAQLAALAVLRPSIEADARCLLSAPAFKARIPVGRVDPFRLQAGDSELSLDLDTWIIQTLPFPVQILSHEFITDNWAYNDENHYTDYRYELTVQIGNWQKKASASVASLTPGNPMHYQRQSFYHQQSQIAYDLRTPHRWNEPPLPELTDLNWTIDQEQHLKQELSCLLAFVGELLTVQPQVETFCYPVQYDSATLS